MNFDQLVDLCRKTHEQLLLAANRSIDTHLVARNFLFGLYIVQFEQEGADRARYGKQTLKELSNALKSSASRGFSVDNLELMRRFYLEYRSAILHPPISETPSRKSLSDTPGKSDTLSRISAEAITANFAGNEMISHLPCRFITELGRDFCARPKITRALLVPICHLTALRWPHTLRTTIPAKPLRKHAQTGGLLFSGRKCFDS